MANRRHFGPSGPVPGWLAVGEEASVAPIADRGRRAEAMLRNRTQREEMRKAKMHAGPINKSMTEHPSTP
jgi:hypothetical protein